MEGCGLHRDSANGRSDRGRDGWLVDPSLTLKGLLHISSREHLKRQAAVRNAVDRKILARVFAMLDSHGNRKAQKPTSVGLIRALIAVAHKTLTESDIEWEGEAPRGDKAAGEMLRHIPEIKPLLGGSVPDKDRIMRIRKDFGLGRGPTDPVARAAYELGCRMIEERKGIPDALERMAAHTMRAIKASLSP
jgi:hypothetical protein